MLARISSSDVASLTQAHGDAEIQCVTPRSSAWRLYAHLASRRHLGEHPTKGAQVVVAVLIRLELLQRLWIWFVVGAEVGGRPDDRHVTHPTRTAVDRFEDRGEHRSRDYGRGEPVPWLATPNCWPDRAVPVEPEACVIHVYMVAAVRPERGIVGGLCGRRWRSERLWNR